MIVKGAFLEAVVMIPREESSTEGCYDNVMT